MLSPIIIKMLLMSFCLNEKLIKPCRFLVMWFQGKSRDHVNHSLQRGVDPDTI